MPVANNFLDNFSNLDVDYAQDFDEKEESGEFKLWAEVTYKAINNIYDKEAHDFLFDPKNLFIEYLCNKIGIDIEVFRRQMRIIEKQGQMKAEPKKRAYKRNRGYLKWL